MQVGETGEAKTAGRRPALNRTLVFALIGAWGAGALLLFVLGDAAGARFLNLPLGAYLAGQGALMAALVVGAHVALGDEGDQTR